MDIRKKSIKSSDEDRKIYPDSVAVSGPSTETLNFLKTTDARIIAEIGIYNGDTSIEIANWLDGDGELHLFDYHDKVDAVLKALKKQGHKNAAGYPSSYKILDSYNWPLGKLLAQNSKPIYDYIFIDGAHTWAIDALTTLLADKLLKVGGYLDFDDYQWTLKDSPSLNPKVFPLTGKMYTDEQIACEQVKMIIDALIRPDHRYKEVVENRVFQKTKV